MTPNIGSCMFNGATNDDRADCLTQFYGGQSLPAGDGIGVELPYEWQIRGDSDRQQTPDGP
jgi:hypothetical protein